MDMTEEEWLSTSFALLFITTAATTRRDADGEPIEDEWRAVAARVACLQRLGTEMPLGVREWVTKATAYLGEEDREASAGQLLDRDSPGMYHAFREAYAVAGPELRQRLAAAQDVFRGSDYYACEYYLLEDDETSLTYTGDAYLAESAAHCDIIRDIFGNPFRPVTFAPTWRTTDAVGVARSMYDSRDFAAMPILADALEDAGCDSADVLAHCRGDGPHVRGCWVVDLVLGKN
jgi:hypothetical protein